MTTRFLRRRRRSSRLLVLAAACVLALAVAGTATALSSGWDPGSSAAPASPTVDPAVASQLSVFGRAQTSADALPAAFRATLQQAFGWAGPDVGDARQVKASDGQAAYLVPANGGACVINTNEALCSPATSLPGADTVDLCSPRLPQGQIEMEWLLPDGATNVAVGMANGAATSFAPGFNVYIARVPISGPQPKTIEWDTGGQHHSVSAAVPSDVQSENCVHPSDLPPASQLPTAPPGPVGP